MDFKSTLRKLRKERKWSQIALSMKIDIPQTTISDWECGKTVPDINQIKVLATVFRVSILEFIE